MKIERKFTRPDTDVFDTLEWTTRTSRITNADGSVVFEMTDAEVPSSWSQLATDIMVSKYFRKAGVPQFNPDGTPVLDDAGNPVTGPEKSVRQVVHRLAGCWRQWGEQHGYFDTAEDAQAFYDELCHMMLHQMAAPNSPQWFNTGLNFAYGISGPAQGHWIADPKTGEPMLADDAYSHPQPHACFIQSISDDLVNDGGIMDLWVREARLFKYGSGTGTNFSSLRGENEPLSGGGKSSGLMSFLKIGDRAAGAIKSGGTTRRAAKMVCLDADHPDIEDFVNWKVREELKVAALVEGSKHLTGDHKKVAERLGLTLDYDFNGEAYQTVSGQNSNNSIRLTDAFFDAVDRNGDWNLYQRTDGEIARTVPAGELWEQINFAAWQCADPGVQYDSTINAWHTCPGDGRINASNPCSEYMFLDNTACNLASINLMKFYDASSRTFDVERYEHAIDLWTIVLEISVLMASFPSKEIAELSWKFRTLGLGYANLGAMLMQAGIPYDSEEGRAVCGAVSSILTGRSYAASAAMARELGPFAGYRKNQDHMLRVVRNHRRAAHGVRRESSEYEQLRIRPVPIDHGLFKAGRINLTNADDLLSRATKAWDDALELGEQYGYRNAQVTVIAPTGTIGLLMDCDTTGVEPDFALTKFKKLAGGGYFKIANQSLKPALQALGYDEQQVRNILAYVMGTLSLDTPMPVNASEGEPVPTFRQFLIDQGYTSEDLLTLEDELPRVFELGFAFNAWSMPEQVLRNLGIDPETARADASFNGLKALGLTGRQIDELNHIICGTQTVEGAPHLKEEHLAVFDCANQCGKIGRRFIRPEGHIRMMAAAQPFISGAISKTINLPNDASVEDIGAAYRLSWELGLKANALYRDGCKLSQPLSTTSDVDVEDDDEDHEAVENALGEVSSEVAEVASAISTSSASSGTTTADSPSDPEIPERIVERIIERPMRRRLPETRSSLTHKFNVSGHEGYLTVGLYDDGTPGELFITMSKEGSTIGGLMDSLGTAISVALQYGVPVESLVTKFAHQRFEPQGMTTNKDIPFAKSLVDYIFRWMGMEFIEGFRDEHAPKRSPRPKNNGSSSTKNDGSRRSTEQEVRASDATAPNRVKEDSAWSNSTNSSSAGEGGPTTDRTPSGSTPAAPTPSSGPARIDVSSRTSAASMTSHSVSVSYTEQTTETSRQADSALSQATAQLMGDAPACDVCGSITVRNGSCYRCENCGNSMGCS